MITAICKPPIYQISFQFLAVHIETHFQLQPATALLTVHQTVPIKFNNNVINKNNHLLTPLSTQDALIQQNVQNKPEINQV